MNAAYSRAASLDELETLAYAANDQPTLQLIAWAEDAAGVKAEEVRERRTDKLCNARNITGLLAERDELVKRLQRADRMLADARRLEYAVALELRPHIGKDKLPKWAAALRATLRAIRAERGDA